MKQKTGTVNCMIAAVVLCVLAELIGPLKFEVAGIGVTILTMIWVIIMGILLSPMLLGKLIPPLKKMTMLIALPLGLLIGLGRSAVGGTFSLCRDTALGIIGDKYGLESREGMGTLGTYISGSVFGTLFYSFLAPVGLIIGFHPYALAMASGMGSASMMNAATAALADAAPAMYTEQILAYSATSGLLTAVTGVYVEMFLSLPLANWYYRHVNPAVSRLRMKLFKAAPEKEV